MIPGIVAGQASSFAPRWKPTDAPGLRGWWIADSPANTLVSGDLSIVADRSGNGNNMDTYQAVSTNRAAVVPSGLGGRTIWRTDATAKKGAFSCTTADALAISRAASGLTLFALHRMNPAQVAAADTSLLRFQISTSNTARAMIGRGDYGLNAIYAGGRRLDANAWAAASDTGAYGDSWALIVALLDYQAARVDIFVDGALTASNAAFQTAGLTSDTPSFNLSLGHSGGGSSGAYGDHAELGVYRGALSTSDRQKLEGYLMWGWGRQDALPDDHPYKHSAP